VFCRRAWDENVKNGAKNFVTYHQLDSAVYYEFSTKHSDINNIVNL